MPLTRYALIVGTPGRYDAERDDDERPHFKLDIHADAHKWRAAINVKSRRWPAQVAVRRVEGFDHAIIRDIGGLSPGMHPIRYYPKSQRPKPNRKLALDFVRDGLFAYDTLVPVPAHVPGRDNDLMDALARDVIETRKNDGRVFVWGEPYNNHGQRGIHNVHQNQGNAPRHAAQNGADQDGAMILWTGKTAIAYFIVFQSQAYETRPGTGTSINTDNRVYDLMRSLGRME